MTRWLAAIDVAQAEFGLEVGRQLSIVGFNDVPMAAWLTFSLTTYSQPVGEMTRQTMAIIRAIAAGDLRSVNRVVEGGLTVRKQRTPASDRASLTADLLHQKDMLRP